MMEMEHHLQLQINIMLRKVSLFITCFSLAILVIINKPYLISKLPFQLIILLSFFCVGYLILKDYITSKYFITFFFLLILIELFGIKVKNIDWSKAVIISSTLIIMIILFGKSLANFNPFKHNK